MINFQKVQKIIKNNFRKIKHYCYKKLMKLNKIMIFQKMNFQKMFLKFN